MPRSLRVQKNYIDKVKLSLRRNGYPSQRVLAEDVGYALATVNNFLTGKPVDFATFEELCRQLALDWKEIAALDLKESFQTRQRNASTAEITDTQSATPPYPNGAVPLDSPFYIERHPIEAQIKEEIKKPGALVRIKAPRETGKTIDRYGGGTSCSSPNSTLPPRFGRDDTGATTGNGYQCHRDLCGSFATLSS